MNLAESKSSFANRDGVFAKPILFGDLWHDLLSGRLSSRALGHVFYCGVLIIAAYQCVTLTVDPIAGEKVINSSLLGLVVGGENISCLGASVVLRLVASGMLLMATVVRKPWTVTAATALFGLVMSSMVETHYFVRHQSNIVLVSLIVLTMVSWFDRRKHPLPTWAAMAILFVLTVGYTHSGLAKLQHSGFAWADGGSLVFWLSELTPYADAWWLQPAFEYPLIATMGQAIVLAAELLAVGAFFIPRLRPWVGFILVGFHLSIEYLMGLQFYGNIFIDAFVLILCQRCPRYRVSGHRWLWRWLMFSRISKSQRIAPV